MQVGVRFFFFFQAEDGIRDLTVTGVQTCALPILTAGDADTATRMLRELDAEMGRSVETVRAMAYQLRPPVLDELGLAGALRAAADAPAPPSVSVRLAGVLPDLPAALEVAAYRIAVEAVTNVRRHARAANCEI